MKFKTYRIIDLTILVVLAFGLEILCTWLENSFLGRIRPYPVLGLLFTLIAVSRWGWIGLIVAPFNAVGNFIAGRFMLRTTSLRDAYTFLMLCLAIVSNLTIAINYLIKQKKGINSNFHSISSCLSDVMQIVFVNFVVNFLLFYLASLFKGAGTQGMDGIGAVLLSQLLFNVVAYIVLAIAVPILGSQGTLDNVKKRLFEIKKEREHEKQYYEQLYDPIDHSKK